MWPAWPGSREAVIYQLILKKFNYLRTVTAVSVHRLGL